MDAGDRFAVTALVRRTSPLLERKALEAAGEEQVGLLKEAKAACDGLLALVKKDEKPTARSILRYVAETNLFTIPDVLAPFSVADVVVPEDEIGAPSEAAGQEEEVDNKSELGGWRLSLEAPFDQIERYDRYSRGVSQFDTHQGVKWLEFPRVMVVVSDEEARGFMFAYDKLFETKAKSKSDLQNEAAGNDTTIDRTRRLFYVTCSRAEQSLVVVYYTTEPISARDAIIRQGWFEPAEIELIA